MSIGIEDTLKYMLTILYYFYVVIYFIYEIIYFNIYGQGWEITQIFLLLVAEFSDRASEF